MAITTEKIQTLLRDLENDSVECTIRPPTPTSSGRLSVHFGYRIIGAEAMKVLGFVNRFSRGVLRVEEELKENGNGKPEFSLNLGTAFMVIEHISSSSNEDVNEEKSEEKENLTDTERNLLQLLSVNPNAAYTFISDNLGIGETSVYNHIRALKKRGWLKREDGRKHGKWVVLKTLETQTK